MSESFKNTLVNGPLSYNVADYNSFALLSLPPETGICLNPDTFFNGPVTYFKPDVVPAESSGNARKYWEKMIEMPAGNYINYCNRDLFRLIRTPHEHDLMMDDPSLDIIVPEIYRALGIKLKMSG